MGHSQLPGTNPTRRRRLKNWIKSTPKAFRRALSRTDIWVQDHTVLATVLALAVFLTVTGIAMGKWGEAFLALAKEYQPLFTIVWIVISAILLILGTFRSRRAARLIAAAEAAKTTTETTETTSEPAKATAETAEISTEASTITALDAEAADAEAGSQAGAETDMETATGPKPGITTSAETDTDTDTDSGVDAANSEDAIISVISAPAPVPTQATHTTATEPGADRV
ncbi:hypothetical protein [Streptomyces sp. NPDC093225]|uniref:hypothetical protein n=1 Tax=Streptomyces sp. NPDC093225 TaxID=3366034 RepID=UPI003828A58C